MTVRRATAISSGGGGVGRRRGDQRLVLRLLVKHAAGIVRRAVVSNARRMLMRKVLEIDREGFLLAREAHARAFDTALLHRDHQSTDELVPALKTEQFVLPVRLV